MLTLWGATYWESGTFLICDLGCWCLYYVQLQVQWSVCLCVGWITMCLCHLCGSLSGNHKQSPPHGSNWRM